MSQPNESVSPGTPSRRDFLKTSLAAAGAAAAGGLSLAKSRTPPAAT